MYEINILVVNTLNNEITKPDKYNTYWSNGELYGNQDYLKIKYEIVLIPDYPDYPDYPEY